MATTSVTLSAGWSGRFWPRTACSGSDTSLVCETGQCGPSSGGNIDCTVQGATANDATLFELSSAAAGGTDNFDVSLVSGYNVPVVVTVQLPADQAVWEPNTIYAAGTQIVETIGTDIFRFTAAGSSGTSGATKPDFPATWNAEVKDGPDIEWINTGPVCQTSGCVADLLATCPTELQVMVGGNMVACDAPANACVPTTATCHDDLPFYQCQNNAGVKDLFGNVMTLQSPNADTFVCFSEDDCPAGTTCQLDPAFEQGSFAFPSGAGLCTPVTQNGGCAPGDDGEPCPSRAFPFVEYRCHTLAGGGADAQVCVPSVISGFGDLWWNAANWSEVASTSCTDDGGCSGDQKCLAPPFMRGHAQCTQSQPNCACYSPKTCAVSTSAPNGNCPGPNQCLNQDGVPDRTDGVNCTTETCYCGPQGVYSGTCGPTNPGWNAAATGVGNWPAVFKAACPVAYAYQFDDPSSNWSCKNGQSDLVDYRVEFCLAP